MISVFTPLSATGNPYVREAYMSLLSQSDVDWEWLVLPNNGGELPPLNDRRIRVLEHRGEIGIGALKRRCCEEARGDIFLELDHDDVLRDDALALIHAAVDDGAGFVFSDFCEFSGDERSGYASNTYNARFGWESYDVVFRGTKLRAMRAPDATPQNMRRVEWAPNHVRAWSREAYRRAGGHDGSLEVADDHDLVLRTYLSGAKMVHVPECLYFYRVHTAQATNGRNKNALIQELDWKVYEHRFEELALKFARDAGLEAIDLCGGINPRAGFRPLDISLGHDLNGTWPLRDSSVGVIRACDAIEHLSDKIHTMNEAHRVLAPGGFFISMTPSTDGRGAFQDPTHVSYWNENSFWYYTRAELQKYVPAISARFQTSRLRSIFPSDWHRQNAIPYVEAQLIALKPGYRPMGEVGFSFSEGK